MIDLRSDTVTKPDERMRKAMYEAEVGDDVYGEDPTVNRLERLAAEVLGKESALFVTSGTQGNQIAGLVHCRQGQEVIMESQAHLFLYEAAAMSALAGVQIKTLKGTRGAMNPAEVEAAIRGADIHEPETGLITLENTHNKAGGAVLPLENMREIYEIAGKHHIPVHLDGARLFNAQAATGISVKEYAKYTDTVQFCLSKGLGAPVGSIIAGSDEFIKKARKWRKRLGGGLRQVGVIAAPGIIALENAERLKDDNANAKKLADGLLNIKGVAIDNEVQTNIILMNLSDSGIETTVFLEQLKENGIIAGGFGPGIVRYVTNNGVSEEDIDETLKVVQKIMSV
ncbi:threonine aldolase family protein [Jeotgalibacillus salarius]|uniref:Aminotransferase class I/II-fold pyridoxal phosphate-dependent enzyme n=1 Tax=Jeotgalibacillus salarius TaxID=546023 RepID=A0A4Y8LIF1_9BACL|nr:GntG family PLP-dependent aldolase [Jeotgalibacillus salarius]TFE02258.1 aminotransferase class I/II-fold pyridoxal phosphate-dependent enzyme [Jeotgalibacillus salarius]